MAEPTASSDSIPTITQDPIPTSEMEDMSVKDQRSGAGKGKRGGKSGARGGRATAAGEPKNREFTVSKALSWMLRHGAEKESLKLDREGYANVEELVCCSSTLLV